MLKIKNNRKLCIEQRKVYNNIQKEKEKLN